MSGILLQLPVPDGLDGNALTALISPDKDVDGLTPISAGRLAQGRPGCAVHAARRDRAARRAGVELEGAEAVVVGRSDLVGKPVAALLLARNGPSRCATRARATSPASARGPAC